MTTPVTAAGLAPLAPAAPAATPPTGQDLFQYLATVNPSGIPAAPSPGQLGGAMVDHLKGFLDRSQSLTERAQALTNRAPETPPAKLVHRGSDATQLALPPASNGAAAKPSVGEAQIDKVIQSLGMMFDYSIETQMVVRGATQVSGAANTLLRGQ
jgi:hypothetical protein